MASLVIYGTELEELDDEKSGISNKRPLRVEEQVVTDERGRRRFHGAFTGGFSAGYFNTVGSKEGWEPKQFRSSRDERGGRIDYKPEDFMDEEDLGEFGIAARQMKTSIEAGESGTEKHLLAWERSTQSSLESSLSARLEKLIRPTSDSMGVRMLKKMGWREGQGIGSKMSRKALERQKLNEDRASCKKGIYDEEAVKEADEMAPNFQFAPADVDPVISKSCEGLHGLGYRGIQQTSVLSEKYGSVEVALKTRKKGRGISGQAFGVGAFEDDDVNIYTNYDFSQYDFSIGGGAESSTAPSSSDTSFVMAVKRQPARQFFEPPRLPPNFCPVHTPIFPDISQMPTSIKQFGEKMNHVQRAKFLGEVDPKVVLELIHDKDRGRLTASGSLTKNDDVLKTAFEEEPMKQARFKQYINYLKRGLNFPKPADMGTLEWEQELNDFQNKLPSELRSLLPEVQMRQIPLARIDVAAPIANILKSKFIPSSSTSSSKMRELKGDERLAAVKMKMFGEKTRACHEWHPAKQLAKRFNVPDPYPSSTLLGVPHLQRANKTETLANLGADVVVLGSTAQELEYRAGVERKEPEGKRKNLKDEKQEEKSTTETTEKPSEDFLKAIFGDSDADYDTTDDEDESVADNDDDQEKAMEPTTSKDLYGGNVGIKQPSPFAQKVVTVMDISLEEENGNKEFGPAPPPTLSLLADNPELHFTRKKERREEHKHSTSKKRKKEKKKKQRHKEKHKKRSAHHQKSSRSGSRSKSSTDTISID